MNPSVAAAISILEAHGGKVRLICETFLHFETGPMVVPCDLYPACDGCQHEACYRRQVIEMPGKVYVDGRYLEPD